MRRVENDTILLVWFGLVGLVWYGSVWFGSVGLVGFEQTTQVTVSQGS